MIWDTGSSWSCFCWLYRASTASAAKNMINLISVLTTWWCPSVQSFLVCWKTGALSCQNSVNLCPASFCTPRSNLPITPGISWLPPFAFQSAVMKLTFFLVLVLEVLAGIIDLFTFSFFCNSGWGIDFDYCDIEWLALDTEFILSFLRLHPS